jgi:hypothetical protein
MLAGGGVVVCGFSAWLVLRPAAGPGPVPLAASTGATVSPAGNLEANPGGNPAGNPAGGAVRQASVVPPPMRLVPDAAPSPPPALPQAEPAFAITTATMERIRRNMPSDLSVFRLAENPDIVVLDFASLDRQGRMLDRIAALTEKRGLPHDRILTPEELARAVHTEGSASGWFYYGHDYDVAELNRFFDTAARDGVPLNADESQLARLLSQLGWRGTDARGALISLPRLGADAFVTPRARDTILTHELSHGEYFSNPAYTAYVHQFYLSALTAPEREAFRTFLARQGYDRDQPALMENETHAYLLFTTDPEFFSPDDAGLTPARRGQLRAQFLAGMPSAWLRDVLARLR